MADWLPHDLLLKLDRCLMAHAVEGRTPFLDPAVAAAAFRLPDALKVRDGMGKWLLRQWLARHCAAARPFARKQGFTVPVGAWIAGRGERLGKLVAAQPGVADIADPSRVAALFRAAAGRREGQGPGTCCSMRSGTGRIFWGFRRRGMCSRRWPRDDRTGGGTAPPARAPAGLFSPFPVQSPRCRRR